MLCKISTSRIVLAILVILNLGYTVAFWRLECQGTVGLARIDPLMDYGDASEHVHSIKGGSAFTPTSLSAQLADSKCSSCDVREDLSSYWTPALYFMNADDNTVEIVPEKPPHKTYYFLNDGYTSGGVRQKIEAFPPGFKMIAGNNYQRNSSLPNPDPNPLGPWAGESQALREHRALGFTCMNYNPGFDTEGSLSRHFMPDKAFLDQNCADGLRLELMFPSCWNGQVDGGKDHKSHVAYPDNVMTGNCPDGYDRRLVSLFFETIVATDLFKGKNGKFVLSNGDPTGFGFHGDFIEAWKPGVLQQAIDQCTNPSGFQTDCGVFSFFDDPGHCRLESMPTELAEENVEGPRRGLPNGIQVEYGPEEAIRPQKKGHPYVPAPAAPPLPAVGKVPTVPLVIPSQFPPAPSSGSEYAQLSDNDMVQQPSSSSRLLPSTPSPVKAPPPSTFSTSTSASTTPETTKPSISVVTAPASAPIPPVDVSSALAALFADVTVATTESFTSGGAAYEVVVMVDEVTVTVVAEAEVTVTVTSTADAAPTPPGDLGYHVVKRRLHQHHPKRVVQSGV